MTQDDPFSHRERETIAEVFARYDLTPAQVRTAWRTIAQRWHDTSGRFYAYATAHDVAAKIIGPDREIA
jgi:hypothetical protein